MRKGLRALVLGLAAGVAAAGCRRGDARPATAGSADTASSAAAATASPAMRAADGPSAAPALRLVVAPTGNEVRYLVREQLAGFDLPNDAVGRSSAVSGGIAFEAAGRVLLAESKFVVDASTFASDRDRRDGYVRRRTLGAEEHPTVQLVPTEARGLTLPLPRSGTRTFSLVGDLTVRGTTRPTVWRVTAQFGDRGVTGTAATSFTFAELDLQQPRVPVVLSVADTIRLEYDFNLVRGDAAARP